MLIGRIEHLCADRIVGWALDTDRPLHPVQVQVRDARSKIIASGLAYGYREAPTRAVGWHGFRLLTDIDVTKLGRSPLSPKLSPKLSLWSAENSECIARSRRIPLAPHPQANDEAADILTDDPTTLDAPSQLVSLAGLFRHHQQQRGVETFIRCCYAYVLGRPADHAGLSSYVEQLRAGIMQPHEVLLNLIASAEFHARRTRLPAPWCTAFPFK